MRPISWSTNPGISSLPAVCSRARAGLASHAAIAPAPISAALREMRVSSIISPLTLRFGTRCGFRPDLYA